MNCPVCFSPPERPVLTLCNHLFCHKCLHRSLRALNDPFAIEFDVNMPKKCPQCRAIIKKRDLRAILGQGIDMINRVPGDGNSPFTSDDDDDDEPAIQRQEGQGQEQADPPQQQPRQAEQQQPQQQRLERQRQAAQQQQPRARRGRPP